MAEVAYQFGLAEDARVCELLTVDGHSFPTTDFEGEAVPEAWSYDQLVLPHLQPEEARLFPKAPRPPDAGDVDPPQRSLMGERWADMEPETPEHGSNVVYINAVYRQNGDGDNYGEGTFREGESGDYIIGQGMNILGYDEEVDVANILGCDGEADVLNILGYDEEVGVVNILDCTTRWMF